MQTANFGMKVMLSCGLLCLPNGESFFNNESIEQNSIPLCTRYPEHTHDEVSITYCITGYLPTTISAIFDASKKIRPMASIDELKMIASQVRRDSLRMVHGCQSGHPGGSLGCADFLTALYFEIMEHKTDFDMDGMHEDLFFLSNGHISPVWYSTLSRAGYFEPKEMYSFRKLNTRLQGHPTTHEHLPGVRVASGSLGQGMSVAIGAALAKRYNGDKHLVYSLHGDGELEEGQNWEAIMSAAHLKADNLVATVDWNGQQIDGPTEKVMALGDLNEKFRVFGWLTVEFNGNNMEEVVSGMKKAKSMTGQGKPVAVLMRTVMGYPVDFMMGSHEWHGIAPNDAQLEKALAQLPVTLGDY